MQFTIRPIDADVIDAIADWHYPPPYDFNNWTKNPPAPAATLDARRWPERYFAVVDEHDDLVGFFEFEQSGDWVTIGLGLRPDLTGKGLGLSFVDAGLAFARSHFGVANFHLTVATFNQRAIKVYERAGFLPAEVVAHFSNGAMHDFLHMRKRERVEPTAGCADSPAG